VEAKRDNYNYYNGVKWVQSKIQQTEL